MAKPSKKKTILILLVFLGVITAVVLWITGRDTVTTDAATIEAHVIPIAPKVPGYVTELNIRDNQHVKKGDVLLKIDPRDYQVALEQAKAELAAAEARLIAGQHNNASTAVSAPSNLASAQSQVEAATAEWNNTLINLKRQQKLGDIARSQESLDNAVAAEKSARSAMEDAKARLRTAETAPDAIAASEASVKELEAAVMQAEAAVKNAENNLYYTTMTAPQDGRITRRSVEQGAYIQPGQQLTTIVSDDVWVMANFKETQLEHMKPGQVVDIEIDAYPGQEFHGHVDSIQSGTGARFSLFPPENATGNFVKIVQRVPVKITFDQLPGREFQVGPGMSVEPKVHIQ